MASDAHLDNAAGIAAHRALGFNDEAPTVRFRKWLPTTDGVGEAGVKTGHSRSAAATAEGGVSDRRAPEGEAPGLLLFPHFPLGVALQAGREMFLPEARQRGTIPGS
jgi:hypothetical protein